MIIPLKFSLGHYYLDLLLVIVLFDLMYTWVDGMFLDRGWHSWIGQWLSTAL